MISIIAPSLDDKRIYPLRCLEPGGVHRSRVVLRHASGKGANAARAASCLGSQVLLCALSGFEMRTQLEEQFAFSTVRLDLTITQQPTRSCITILEEQGRATELVQEALPLEQDEATAFLDRAMACCRGSAAVLLTGSLPAGLPEEFYSRCARVAKNEDARVVIDAQRQPLVHALGTDCVDVVKINREELGNTLATEVRRENVDEAVVELRQGRTLTVIITDGRLPVRVYRPREDVFEVMPPVVKTVNPVGSGDVMSGVLAKELAEGQAFHKAVRYAVAAASANAASLLPAVFDAEQVNALF